jgi:hypothetical protein
VAPNHQTLTARTARTPREQTAHEAVGVSPLSKVSGIEQAHSDEPPRCPDAIGTVPTTLGPFRAPVPRSGSTQSDAAMVQGRARRDQQSDL